MTDDRLLHLLKQALGPAPPARARDLWPAMLGRLSATDRRAGWIDWLAAAGAASGLAFAPGLLRELAYIL